MSEQRPLPKPTRDTQPFWDACAAGKLKFQKCDACSHMQFYPRPFCVECLSENVSWVESSGKGSIYTFTVNHRAANPYMKNKLPYVVAIIELEEGVRMLANILTNSISSVRVGHPVRLSIERVTDEISLPQFELA